MVYDLSNKSDLKDFDYQVNYLKLNNKKVELKKIGDKRTIKQNSALHKYFQLISDELNDLGIEYQYSGITGKVFECRYNPFLVKNFIWKPIQLALFGIDSTTKLDTNKINEIVDVITKFFSEKGVYIPFPSE